MLCYTCSSSSRRVVILDVCISLAVQNTGCTSKLVKSVFLPSLLSPTGKAVGEEVTKRKKGRKEGKEGGRESRVRGEKKDKDEKGKEV